jgi:hypothetical protein
LKVTNMNKQVVSYAEACNLFKDHCEVLLKGRQLKIFEYEIEIMDVLKLIKDSDRLLYNEILFKWCADVGLHIT